MKKIISSVLAITLCVYAFGQKVAVANHSTTVSSSTAAFSWSETTYDFGKTKVGIPVSYEFRFTNAGAVPLIISSVKASCGCTVTAYTKDPVPNGGSGFVRATYNAQKAGKYSKTVAVYANTPKGMIQLTVKGEIIQ